jgi:hypothetical protein
MSRVPELGVDIDEVDDVFKTGFPTYGTPLSRAIKTRKREAVSFLLKNGGKLARPGYDGFTPWEILSIECCSSRNPCRADIRVEDKLPEIR